jgi:hypothetical protein
MTGDVETNDRLRRRPSFFQAEEIVIVSRHAVLDIQRSTAEGPRPGDQRAVDSGLRRHLDLGATNPLAGDRLGQIFHVDENALYTIVSSPDHDQTFLQKTGKAAYWTLVQWQQGVFPAMSANSSKRNRASADEIR